MMSDKIDIGLTKEQWKMVMKALDIYSSVAVEFKQYENNARQAHELSTWLHNSLCKLSNDDPFADDRKPIDIDDDDLPF